MRGTWPAQRKTTQPTSRAMVDIVRTLSELYFFFCGQPRGQASTQAAGSKSCSQHQLCGYAHERALLQPSTQAAKHACMLLRGAARTWSSSTRSLGRSVSLSEPPPSLSLQSCSQHGKQGIAGGWDAARDLQPRTASHNRAVHLACILDRAERLCLRAVLHGARPWRHEAVPCLAARWALCGRAGSGADGPL